MEMIAEKMSQPVRDDLVLCSWCDTYLDNLTREKVEVPEGTRPGNYTICGPCKDIVLAELRERK